MRSPSDRSPPTSSAAARPLPPLHISRRWTGSSGASAPISRRRLVAAVNRFIGGLRSHLEEATRWVDAAAAAVRRTPSDRNLQVLLERKERVASQVLYVEGIFDFYFDLFVQRLSSYGERLRAVDRIAAN